ncbi:MAG: hypothetical protein WA066_02820 [Candidatus Omnitrophota bacterium]
MQETGLDNQHWNSIDYKQRCTRKEAQNILINHPTIIFHGTLYEINIKYIGAGVYEIFKKTRTKVEAK